MPVIPEVDFPRGGGEKLKSTNVSHSKHGRTLFQAISNDDRKNKRKSKDTREKYPSKRKKTDDNDNDEDENGDANVDNKAMDTSLSISFIQLLTTQTLTDSINILGVVFEVKKEKVLFSLPGNLMGMMSITDICDAYSDVLKQHLEGNTTEELASLNDLFTAGSQFTCHVKHIDSSGKAVGIHLTLNPKDINQCFRSSDLKNGMVLQGAVQSQEDHGYVIDFGIPGTAGFLQTKNAETFIKHKNNGLKLCVGKVLPCLIEREKSNGLVNLHSVNVVADPKRIMKSMITEEMNLNLNNFLPGMQVPVTIQKICDTGLVVRVWKWTGLIHKLHLNLLWDQPSDYKLNEHYVARVLYLHPLLKVLHLSLQPHLSFAYPKNLFTDVERGQIFHKAIVIGKSFKGVNLRISEELKGFCPVQHVSDRHKVSDKFMQKHFAPGSKKRAQVIGWNAVDNTVIVTMKPSLLSQPEISITELKAGDIVKCTISEAFPKGLRVKVGTSLQGIIPQIHISDTYMKSPETRYKIDEELTCRVLRINKERKAYDLELTLKKSLLSHLHVPLTSFEDVQAGDLVEGWIVLMSELKVVVGFYNDIRGIIPTGELRRAGIVQPAAVYRTGQVITCRVTALQVVKQVLFLSPQIQELQTSVILKEPTKKRDQITLGKVYDGSVISKWSDGLLLKLMPSNFEAVLPKFHLSDHSEHFEQLLDMYRVGDVIEGVVGFSNKPNNIVSKKPVLLKFLKENRWHVKLEELKECEVIPSVVNKKLENGALAVELPTGLNTNLHEKNFEGILLPKELHGLTLMVGPRKKKSAGSSFVPLSCRLRHCWDGTSDMVLDLLENLLEEKKVIFDHLRSSEEITNDLASLQIGEMVMFTITNKSEAGVIGIIGNDIQAIATVNHIRGLVCEVGDIVHGLVVNLDLVNNVAELTLHQSIVRSKELARNPVVELNLEANGVILDVKETYALVFLRKPAASAFAYLPIRKHLNDWKDHRKKYKIGSTKKVVIKRITSHGVFVILKDSYNLQLARQEELNEDASLPLPDKGVMCDAVVTLVSPFQMNITLQTNPKMKGRVHITEIADDVNDGENPLKKFQLGNEISIRILEIQEIKESKDVEHGEFFAECSMKQSIFNAQQRLRTGRTRPNLKHGAPLLGYVQEFTENGLVLVVTPSLTGIVETINMSTKLEILRDPKSHMKIGDGFHTHVIKTEKHILQLTMIDLPELTVGTLVNGKIFTCDTRTGVHLDLAHEYHGNIAPTDISDNYDQVLKVMSLIADQNVIQSCILDVKPKTKQVKLSLRNSRVQPSVRTPITDPEIHEVRVGLTCRAFVQKIEGGSATVVMGTFLCGILPLGNQMTLKKGSVITVKVTEITYDGVIVEKCADASVKPVSLKSSAVVSTIKKGPASDLKSVALSSKLDLKLSSRVGGTLIVPKDATKVNLKSTTPALSTFALTPKKSTPKVNLKSTTPAPVTKNKVDLKPSAVAAPIKHTPKLLTEKEMNEAPRLEIGENFLWDVPGEQPNDSSSDDGGDDASEVAQKKKKKKVGVHLNEQELYKMERQLADDSNDPQSVDGFDKLILTSPNSSIIWLKYMAYHLQNTEVEKARSVAERALKIICFRDEGEKLNIWVAYLNLENLYGTKELLDGVFKRALQANEPRKIYDHLIKIYIDTQKNEEAEALYASMLKRFKDDQQVWMNYMTYLMRHEKADMARKVLERSFKSLAQKSHVGIISRFAQLEFKFGEAERGRTMFENIVANFPRRTDLWSVYIDLMIKGGDQDTARNLIQRALTSDIPQKRIKTFRNKYSHLLEKAENSAPTHMELDEDSDDNVT